VNQAGNWSSFQKLVSTHGPSVCFLAVLGIELGLWAY
jgi:hypothetical protein